MSLWHTLISGLRTVFAGRTDNSVRERTGSGGQPDAAAVDAAAITVEQAHPTQPAAPIEAAPRVPDPAEDASPYRLVYTSRRTGADRVLPFVIGVVGDFSGRGGAAEDNAPAHFVDIDRESFAAVMTRIASRLELALPDSMAGAGKLVVPLTFSHLADFDPEHVSRVAAAVVAEAALDGNDADSGGRVDRLAADVIGHPDFVRLSRAWHSLHRLVSHTSTGPLVRIRVMDYARPRMVQDLQAASTPAESYLCKTLRLEYARADGEPFALLVVDGEFHPALDDIALLDGLAQVGSGGWAHVLTAAAPQAYWPDLHNDSAAANGLDSEIVQRWRALREGSDARSLVVATFASHTSLHAQSGMPPQAPYVLAERIAADFARDEWPGNVTCRAAVSTWDSVKARDALFAENPDDPCVRLARLGLAPVVLEDGAGGSFSLFHPQSLHKPQIYGSPSDRSSVVASIWASLPALLAAYRLMHYLQMQYVSLTASAGTATAPDALLDRAEGDLKKWVADHWKARRPKPFYECPVELRTVPGGRRILVAYPRPEANGPVEDTMRFIAALDFDPSGDT